MGIDLDFWKYKKGVYLDNAEVYKRACCEGSEIDGLEYLPVNEIRQKISDMFADWTKIDNNNYEHNEKGALEIYTTSQIVRFDCYDMSSDDMNTIIDIMIEFDCPLYDPQIGERFDKAIPHKDCAKDTQADFS